MDLHDLEHNTRDGLHMASLAGAWIAVAGFGGMRTDRDGLHFAPRLPDRIERLPFRLCYRGRRSVSAVAGGVATYQLVSGDGEARSPTTAASCCSGRHRWRRRSRRSCPGPTPTQPPGGAPHLARALTPVQTPSPTVHRWLGARSAVGPPRQPLHAPLIDRAAASVATTSTAPATASWPRQPTRQTSASSAPNRTPAPAPARGGGVRLGGGGFGHVVCCSSPTRCCIGWVPLR